MDLSGATVFQVPQFFRSNSFFRPHSAGTVFLTEFCRAIACIIDDEQVNVVFFEWRDCMGLRAQSEAYGSIRRLEEGMK
jgi:hypothetical protein